LKPHDALEGESRYRLEFVHIGIPDLDHINPHTIGILRKAKELGSDYDGWGTLVLKP
jgi:hypothetical protein